MKNTKRTLTTTTQETLEIAVSRRTLLKAALGGAGALVASRLNTEVAWAGGPNTTAQPYLLPSSAGVTTTAVLTAGDAADNGYRMTGLPDGLGAMAENGQIVVLMNHEIANTAGVVRGHGSAGAFVSKWTINRTDFRVISGEDLTQDSSKVHLWDVAANDYVTGTTAWNRLCSADLPDPQALRHGMNGTQDRILFNGEETTEGRAWARIVTGPQAGEAWQLPRLGRSSFENVLLCPTSGGKTLAVALDDTPNFPCQLYVYAGDKRDTGHPIERAGLTDGKLFGLKITRDGETVVSESNDYGLGDVSSGYIGEERFALVALGANGDVSSLNASQLEDESANKGVFVFQRTEDGAWDPRGNKGNDFYFVTTASASGNSRLWRLRFDDLQKPELGGTIAILLRGNEGHRQFDNMCVDSLGRIIIQEDPGNTPYVAKVWLYATETRAFVEVAHHNPALFDPAAGSSTFITQDEESSGVISVDQILGEGWFLVNVMAVSPNPDPVIVSGGQMLAMYVHPRIGRF